MNDDIEETAPRAEGAAAAPAERRGFMIGKFFPPQKGHEFLGTFASAHCGGDLTIMVESNDSQDIPGTLRAQWMREIVPGATVVNCHETLPQDPSETPDFWTIWAEVVRRHAPEGVTHVYASETYGLRIAEILGAEFVPVDIERRCRDVSATRVRADPYGMWHMLPAPVRAHYCRRVVLIGPESSGKSTLANELGKVLDTVVAPEYGRLWCDVFGTPDAEGLRAIARGHSAGVHAAKRQANRILVEDTDAAMTQVWADMLGHPRDPDIEAFWTAPDLYVVCDLNAPWVDDGQRWFPSPKDRERFLEKCMAEAGSRGVPWTLASGSVAARVKRVLDAMEEVLPHGAMSGMPEHGL
jgi:HTH-type transcriptional repressor of NAD biosynthesis genes